MVAAANAVVDVVAVIVNVFAVDPVVVDVVVVVDETHADRPFCFRSRRPSNAQVFGLVLLLIGRFLMFLGPTRISSPKSRPKDSTFSPKSRFT